MDRSSTLQKIAHALSEGGATRKAIRYALADETAAAILRGSALLPEREKRIVLGIVRQFGEGR